MIIWSLKLLSTVRKAIAGRKHPHQMAWAVAFGVLLGLIPHGNLLALMVLIVVLTLRLNHAMAALTAIGVSFVASQLDPYSHGVGHFILTDPKTAPTVASFWKLPVVPWTDLNNTVVMGSFLIGVGALIPIFIVTYPLFRLFVPVDAEPTSLSDEDDDDWFSDAELDEEESKVVLIDKAHAEPSAPHLSRPQSKKPRPTAETTAVSAESADESANRPSEGPTELDFQPIETEQKRAATPNVSVETRIDVVRVKDIRNVEEKIQVAAETTSVSEQNHQQPMDEALNYLLRQLRTSQQKDAA